MIITSARLTITDQVVRWRNHPIYYRDKKGQRRKTLVYTLEFEVKRSLNVPTHLPMPTKHLKFCALINDKQMKKLDEDTRAAGIAIRGSKVHVQGELLMGGHEFIPNDCLGIIAFKIESLDAKQLKPNEQTEPSSDNTQIVQDTPVMPVESEMPVWFHQLYEQERGICKGCGQLVYHKIAHVGYVDPDKPKELTNAKLLCPDCVSGTPNIALGELLVSEDVIKAISVKTGWSKQKAVQWAGVFPRKNALVKVNGSNRVYWTPFKHEPFRYMLLQEQTIIEVKETM